MELLPAPQSVAAHFDVLKKNMISFETAIIVLLVAVAASRFISAKALKRLSPEKKTELIDKFTGFSAVYMIPVVVIFIAFVCVIKFTHLNPEVVSWIFYGLMLIFIVVSQVIASKKLKELHLDPSYIKSYTISRVISLSGFAVFFSIILLQ